MIFAVQVHVTDWTVRTSFHLFSIMIYHLLPVDLMFGLGNLVQTLYHYIRSRFGLGSLV